LILQLDSTDIALQITCRLLEITTVRITWSIIAPVFLRPRQSPAAGSGGLAASSKTPPSYRLNPVGKQKIDRSSSDALMSRESSDAGRWETREKCQGGKHKCWNA